MEPKLLCVIAQLTCLQNYTFLLGIRYLKRYLHISFTRMQFKTVNLLKIHGYSYSMIPFVILVVVNSLLIYHSIRNPPSLAFSQSKTRKAKNKTMTYTITTLTIMFIVTTLPYSIATGYWYDSLNSNKNGRIIIGTLSLLSFSYHSFNFVIFFLTNKQFLRECKSFISESKLKYNRNQTWV